MQQQQQQISQLSIYGEGQLPGDKKGHDINPYATMNGQNNAEQPRNSIAAAEGSVTPAEDEKPRTQKFYQTS